MGSRGLRVGLVMPLPLRLDEGEEEDIAVTLLCTAVGVERWVGDEVVLLSQTASLGKAGNCRAEAHVKATTASHTVVILRLDSIAHPPRDIANAI